MNEEDKQRLHRQIQLSLYDIEKIIGMIRYRKSEYYSVGDKKETEYLQALEDRFKQIYIKESPN